MSEKHCEGCMDDLCYGIEAEADGPEHEVWCWRRHTGHCVDGPSDAPAEAAPPPLDGLDVERLAVEIDRHWVFRTGDGIFHCSAGDWEYGPDATITEGDRLAPFSMHIARSLAALRDEGETD